MGQARTTSRVPALGGTELNSAPANDGQDVVAEAIGALLRPTRPDAPESEPSDYAVPVRHVPPEVGRRRAFEKVRRISNDKSASVQRCPDNLFQVGDIGQMKSDAGGCAGIRVVEEDGVRFVEGPPDQRLMTTVEDAVLVVEACFSSGVSSALLNAQNLTEGFFDLSSGEAGAILQKLRNYGIRIAVVCAPGSVRFSSRFAEMAAEEARTGYFRIFATHQAARDWLRTT